MIWLIPGFVALDHGDHPRGSLLPGRAGPDRTKSAHRHPPSPARPVAVPGPIRIGPLGHQRRRTYRGRHLRRRRRPLQQRVRLRRPELGGERARRLESQRPERQQPQSQRTDGAGHRVAGGRRPFNRSCCGRHRCRGTGQSRALRRPAKPECLGSAVGRTDLRGDAGAATGLRHQPVLHSLRRRCAQLSPRSCGLVRAADLRRRRRQGRRPAGRSRLGRRGVPDRATRTPAHPEDASPIRSSKERTSCPRARTLRTR